MTAPLSLEEIAAIEANAPGSHPNSVSYVARWELLSLCALAREALEARDRLKPSDELCKFKDLDRNRATERV
jgi:hypothetical protein